MAKKSQRYSRLARLEEKRARRSAAIYMFLTLLLAVAMLTIGLTSLTQIAGFIANLTSSANPITITDKTPPPPPDFGALPEFTTERSLSITGTAEPGSNVTIKFNGSQKEVLADSEGGFSASFQLKSGSNTLSAIAVDTAGNQSAPSSTYTIVYDTEPPELTLTQPQDGDEFYGSAQQELSLEGSLETGSSLTINDRFVVINPNQTFSFPITLEPGENSFTLVATDQAGNQTELTLAVNYSP